MKTKRYTLAQIADAVTAAGSHYFERDTLRFFGQCRSSFKVRHVAGRVFVLAPSYWFFNGVKRLIGYSFAEFTPAIDGKKVKRAPVISAPYDYTGDKNLASIEAYLKNLKSNKGE